MLHLMLLLTFLLHGLVQERGEWQINVGLSLAHVPLTVQLGQRPRLMLLGQLTAGVGTGGHGGAALADPAISHEKNQRQKQHQSGRHNDQRQRDRVQRVVVVHPPGPRREGGVLRALLLVRAPVLVGGNEVLGAIEVLITEIMLPDAAAAGGAAEEAGCRFLAILLIGRHHQGQVDHRDGRPRGGFSPSADRDPD